MCFSPRCFVFLLLALCCAQPACQTADAEREDKVTQALERKHLARSPKNLAPWKGQSIAGIVAEDFVRVRTARVITGKAKIGLTQTGRTSYHFSLEPSAGSAYGSAVPISTDGYFLTAAHCVSRDKPLKVLAWTREKKLEARPARVVWLGSKEKADVALLKAEIRPVFWLPLARDPALSAGEPILMAGYGGVHLALKSSDGRRVAGGVILKTEAAQSDASGAKWRAFDHTGPMLRGDSGGPVIDGHGRLLGVNSSVYYEYYETWFGPWRVNSSATAISPDAAWIQRLIARDRRRARR